MVGLPIVAAQSCSLHPRFLNLRGIATCLLLLSLVVLAGCDLVPYGMKSKKFNLEDVDRPEFLTDEPDDFREYKLTVYYPSCKSTCNDAGENEEQYPLVLFSPGYSSLTLFSVLQIREVVSRGFVVAAIDHPYISATLLEVISRVLKGMVFDPEVLNSAEVRRLVAVTATDASGAIDFLELTNADEFDNVIDLESIAFFGHSLGG